MYYIGIDPSLSCTAIVIIDYSYTIQLEKTFSTKSDLCDEERLHYLTENILDIIPNKNSFVSVEGLSFASSSQGMMQLAGLHYLLRHKLFINNFSYNIVPPTSWKKIILGKGNLAKDLILKEVYKQYGYDTSNNNLADAYCIARYSIYSVRMGVKINEKI